MTRSEVTTSIQNELDIIRTMALGYFGRTIEAVRQLKENDPSLFHGYPDYWSHVPKEDRQVATAVEERLKHASLTLFRLMRASPLLGDPDRREMRLALRQMLSALRFREFAEWDPRVLHDEDVVLGVSPPGQSEEPTRPSEARTLFQRGYERATRIVKLISPEESEFASAIVSTEVPAVRKYRPNTAFIIMWMDKAHPELEDVKNCFKEVFSRFHINAFRSDDIEHSDVVTKRILDEISTAEFLVADLTGERPSVYYEVGYAHALGKRPILYRRMGTPLHFDLAVHNVAEYENITELRTKLTNRLVALTGKDPSKG